MTCNDGRLPFAIREMRLRYPQPSSGGDAMNWDAIAALGQAVSGLALVLVFAQIRHAREEMRRSVRQGRFDASRQLFVTTATNQPLASALARLWTQSGSPPIPFQEFATGHG